MSEARGQVCAPTPVLRESGVQPLLAGGLLGDLPALLHLSPTGDTHLLAGRLGSSLVCGRSSRMAICPGNGSWPTLPRSAYKLGALPGLEHPWPAPRGSGVTTATNNREPGTSFTKPVSLFSWAHTAYISQPATQRCGVR